MRSASVPLGWIIGCPLLGFIADRIGRRKPVILGGASILLACLAWILFGHTGFFPRYTLGLVAGMASGAAMLPYLMIKEAIPPQYSGTAVETVTSKMPTTIDAAALCKMAERGQIKGAVLDGSLAFHNAISKHAAETKGICSEVAGDPDILLAPDLKRETCLSSNSAFSPMPTALGWS
jgi:hypothetical protein